MTSDMTIARKAMIDSQLRTSGINDPWVLARMNSVPREDFVPAEQRDFAYMDRAVRLSEGAALASPLVHGMILTESVPTPADRVLVIENGTGYLAALVRPLVERLDTQPAAEAATKKGGRKTYSLILIDGAIEALPDAIGKRLEEGGRIVTGIVEKGVTRMAVGRKVAGTVSLQPVADIGIPVLAAFETEKSWSF